MEPNEPEAYNIPSPSSSSPGDEVLVVRLCRKTKPIKIEDANGTVQSYVIKEMMGNARDQWLNTMAARMRMDKEGRPAGVKEFTGLQASLICRCLYSEATDKLVSESVISQWPATAQKVVFDICREVSGLDIDEKTKDEQEKNS